MSDAQPLWSDDRIIDEITNHPEQFAAVVAMRNDYEAKLAQQQQDAPQPDWSQMEPWVKWWTADCNGQTRQSETEPVIDHSGFWGVLVHMDGIFPRQELGDIIDIPIGIDWRTLKQQRPAEVQAVKVYKEVVSNE